MSEKRTSGVKEVNNRGTRMQASKIEIRQCERKEGIFTEIFIDGHKLNGVRSFSLKQGVGNSIPVLTIDLNALNFSIDIQMLRLVQDGMGEIESIKFKNSEIPVRFSEE